jgi:hypothetical protein
MATHILPLTTINGTEVEVQFDYSKGYPATWEEPGCDEEVEINCVMYKGVDVWPLLNEAESEHLENQIFDYRGSDD